MLARIIPLWHVVPGSSSYAGRVWARSTVLGDPNLRLIGSETWKCRVPSFRQFSTPTLILIILAPFPEDYLARQLASDLQRTVRFAFGHGKTSFRHSSLSVSPIYPDAWKCPQPGQPMHTILTDPTGSNSSQTKRNQRP